MSTAPTELLFLAREPTGRLREQIESVCGRDVTIRTLPELTAAAFDDALGTAEIVVGGWDARFGLPASTVSSAPRVRFIQQPGAGVNFIDIDAWGAAGIPVSNASGANAQTVAEWAVGATLSVVRRLTWGNNQLQNGVWAQEDERADYVDLADRTVGIVGMGRIGTRTAEIFAAIGCPVVYTSRSPRPELPWQRLELAELAARADVIVLAMPLDDSTRGMIGRDILGLMKPTTLLVNVARGAVVDEEALSDALDARTLAGAALDVFVTEPLPPTSRLLGRDDVLVSPHHAGTTESSRRRVFSLVASNIRRVLDGEPPINVVNSPPA